VQFLIQQSRTWAVSLEEALEQIRDKYGDGGLSIRECNVQSQSGIICYEFYIEGEESD